MPRAEGTYQGRYSAINPSGYGTLENYSKCIPRHRMHSAWHGHRPDYAGKPACTNNLFNVATKHSKTMK